MSSAVRIAICQLKSHPAIYAGQQMWMEEPFVSDDKKYTLSYLSLQGFRVDSLLEYCKREYINWQLKRIDEIFKLLRSLNPKPHIVVFPEGSIPFQCLPIIHSYTTDTDTTVFAGTHSFLASREAIRIYRTIGISDKTIRRLRKNASQQDTGILPVLVGKRVHLVPKRIRSPFEMTDIAPIEVASGQKVPFRIPVAQTDISVLPLICSEALNFADLKIKGDYNLAVIISYDKTPHHFDGVIQTLVMSKRVVVYCNDGKFGNSCLAIPIDNRRPLWWFDSRLKGQLPFGDSLIVADIDFKNLGTQVGVGNPSINFTLVKACSITYAGDQRSCEVSNHLSEVSKIQDSTARYKEIQRLLEAKKADELQTARIVHLEQLAKDGRDTKDWWDTIGSDWIINLPSLEQLEQRLARYCYDNLKDELLDHDYSNQGIEELRVLLRKAKELAQTQNLGEQTSTYSVVGARSIINRDEDARSILSFLDNPRQKLAQIVGLQQIGKSTVIEKALSQCNYSEIKQVTIHESPSAEYFALCLLSRPNISSTQQPKSLIDEITEQDLSDSLDRINVLWIHNSERLLHSHSWRTSELSQIIGKLIKALKDTKTKVIFETRRALPLELEDRSIFFHKRIHGMERELKSHGVSFLDYQIRRVGLSPQEYDIHIKERIVEKLGGHPVALAVCADALYEEGLSSVQESLEERSGFFLSFVRGLLRSITLSDEERMILRLLSGCRTPIPREIVSRVFDTLILPYVRNLIDLCMIEVSPSSHIRLPGLLSSFFDIEEVPPDVRRRFHNACKEIYTKLFNKDSSKIDCAIEADYHAVLAGREPQLAGKLVDSQLAAAQNFYDSQEYSSAKDILDKILSVRSSDDVLRLSALVDARCNSFNTALSKTETVFRNNPRDTWLLSEISRIALSQGRDDIAERLVGIARSANMEDTSILIVSGRMLLRRGDIYGAKEEFEKAIKVTRRNAWPFYFLGKTYLRLGRENEAIDILYEGEKFIYEKEIRNERVLTAIRTQLGIAYLLSGDIELAAQTLENLYLKKNQDPEVTRAYALVSLKKEGVNKAHEAFEKLAKARIRSRYDRSQYHLFYGIFYLWVGDKGNASKEFSKAHKEDKNNVYVMMKLARTYYDMAMESWIDGEVEISKEYANECASIAKQILKFDADNEVAKDLQIRLYNDFEIEFSKI